MSDHIDKDRAKHIGITPRISEDQMGLVTRPVHVESTSGLFVKSPRDHKVHPVSVDLSAEDIDEYNGIPNSFQPLQVRHSNALSTLEAEPIAKDEAGNAHKNTSTSHRDSQRDSFKFQQSTAVAEAKFKEERDIGSKRIFHSQFYLTSIKNEEQLKAEGIDPIKQPHLRFGRPQLQQVFKDIEEMCRAESIHRVGVCVCGPAAMVSEVSDHCQSTQFAVSCDTIRFDCHKETFDF